MNNFIIEKIIPHIPAIKSLFVHAGEAIASIFERDRVLGVAKDKRKYDLPLNTGSGNNFLRLLIALMTVLAMLSATATFALSAMTERWSAGLEGKFSIEIPATDSGGETLSPDIVRQMTDDVAKVLSQQPDIKDVTIAEEGYLAGLLEPWLGSDLLSDTVPLPGLITATLEEDAKIDVPALQAKLAEVAPRVSIDTHESWLNDVVRFTGALKFAAFLIGTIVGITTLVAVAGGVRSKLSENKEDLELLHLMGASDSYIARQMEKHIFLLSLQSGGIGIVLGALLLMVISLIAGDMGVNLIPDFRITLFQKIILLSMPVAVAILAMATSRWTVMRVLVKMP